jgi:ABC-type multidrug transport system fused ATPase/permease subunit
LDVLLGHDVDVGGGLVKQDDLVLPQDSSADSNKRFFSTAEVRATFTDLNLNELDVEISEGGSNLSSGEKSLVGICRAILRKNKIILLDEATANIDIVTEQTIQKLLKESFEDCTMIVVAHRLQTIIESDRVLVLDRGRVAEFDTPSELRKRPESHFTKLINEIQEDESLRQKKKAIEKKEEEENKKKESVKKENAEKKE